MRINELARKLEVKAKAILDFLPSIGITDKQSHSSSIGEEIAEKVRQHFAGTPAAVSGGEKEVVTGETAVSAPAPPAALPSKPAAPESAAVRGESPVSAPPPESRPAPTAAGHISGPVASPSVRGEPWPHPRTPLVPRQFSGGGGRTVLRPPIRRTAPQPPPPAGAKMGYCPLPLHHRRRHLPW